MAIKVGINGFGRIGRVVLRIMMERPETFDICGINLRKADVDYMVYMIKYDSVFRQFIGTVEREDQNLIVNGHRIRVFSEADAAMIPWESCGAEYVIESTGAYNNTEKASRHFARAARRRSSPRPPSDEATPTRHGCEPYALSAICAWCPTRAAPPTARAALAKVVHAEFGIEQSLMPPSMPRRASRKPVDSRGGSDWRTGRSVFTNIIPLHWRGEAVGRVILALAGQDDRWRFSACRPPTSVVDLTAHLKTSTTWRRYSLRHPTRERDQHEAGIGYTADRVVPPT